MWNIGTGRLTVDVSEPHRQGPVHSHALDKEEGVLGNTLGTFGVSSASYYWSGVAAALGFAQDLAGNTAATCIWWLLMTTT